MTMMTTDLRDLRNAKPEIDDALKQVVRLKRGVLPAGSFGEREKAVLELSNEAVRRVIHAELQDIADSFGEFVEYLGRQYRRHEPGTGRYFSLCGDLVLQRSLLSDPIAVTSEIQTQARLVADLGLTRLP